ncbi:hypothetical protein ZIOFF_047576 [Zingiber officinale]|uniref:Isochorismatase-like domain-containing protein n=1 Tax=Zingiber officinale TaxID=94328 RepID=A0A8J5FPD2_ZINOF|nr:hypothetical protein ZIOFF_047576 [Zingiber officinale]
MATWTSRSRSSCSASRSPNRRIHLALSLAYFHPIAPSIYSFSGQDVCFGGFLLDSCVFFIDLRLSGYLAIYRSAMRIHAYLSSFLAKFPFFLTFFHDLITACGCEGQAPIEPNKHISSMVEEAARLARHFCEMEWPVLVFLDSHHPNKPEPPYPPHYVVGSGEEDLVPGGKQEEIKRPVDGPAAGGKLPDDIVIGFLVTCINCQLFNLFKAHKDPRQNPIAYSCNRLRKTSYFFSIVVVITVLFCSVLKPKIIFECS